MCLNPSRSLIGSLACLVLLSWTGTASAQIPDKFTNLKVLPKKIAKDDLVSTMRQFSVGLGVRCNHCHAQADTAKGRSLDYASDAVEKKKIARGMMKMVEKINKKLIPKAGVKSPAQVQCVTCHRGVVTPETLTDLLKKTVRKDGVEAAKQKYNELRAKYYGSGAYDFGPGSLSALAEWLARERKDPDGAISVMKFSLERDPAVADSYTLLGTFQTLNGDKAAAIESFKRALELDPENRRAQELLKGLQSEK
jgi:tetratricopeptide (TPR) repeat protein